MGSSRWRRRAEKGSTGAEIDLSQLYRNGAPGVTKSRPEEMEWLAASANHGNVAAMPDLGYLSINPGMGVAPPIADGGRDRD
jgi:TPR repeat protein